MGTDCTSKCERLGRAQEDWVGTHWWGCCGLCQRASKSDKMDGFSLKCILNVYWGSVCVCVWKWWGFLFLSPPPKLNWHFARCVVMCSLHAEGGEVSVFERDALFFWNALERCESDASFTLSLSTSLLCRPTLMSWPTVWSTQPSCCSSRTP